MNRIHHYPYLIIVLLVTSLSVQAQKGDLHFKVDQFGYLPDEEKVAVISQSKIGQFSPDSFIPDDSLIVIRQDDNTEIFSGPVTVWNDNEIDSISGDLGWWFDFSSVSAPGEYFIYDAKNNVRSNTFKIAEDVFREVLIAAMRMYFYQRAACNKEEPYAQKPWTDAASHLQDKNARSVFDQNNPATERDVSGGWFDAGDQNKYITYLSDVIHQMLMVYQLEPDVWREDHNIPESKNGIADILDEIKWELQWMKKMQDIDGGVFIKAGATNYDDPSPPSSDTRPRYYGKKCSAASITLSSIFAHAAYVFQTVDSLKPYAAELESGAVSAWEWYHTNEKDTMADNLELMSSDADLNLQQQNEIAMVASMWLWAATGNEEYHSYFKENYELFEGVGNDWWGLYRIFQGDALLYYTTLPGADNTVASRIKAKKRNARNLKDLYKFYPDQNLYRSYIPDWSFHWGHSNPRAATGTINLQMIYFKIDPAGNDEYRKRALNVLHYMHGVNPLGKVYLSNMYQYGAENSVDEMYHSWFCDDSPFDNVSDSYGPAPGYVVGGPNARYTGDVAPPKGEPPAKSYIDWNSNYPENSWEVTEPALGYQSSYIRLCAAFTPPGLGVPIVNKFDAFEKGKNVSPVKLTITKNTASRAVNCMILVPKSCRVSLSLYDLKGRRHSIHTTAILPAGTPNNVSLSLPEGQGVYVLHVSANTMKICRKLCFL